MLALVSFAAALLLALSDTYGKSHTELVVCAVAVGAMAVMLCVFFVVYSRLYQRLENIFEAANLHFIILRPKKRRYCTYGSASFAAKFEGVLPLKSDISKDERDNFLKCLYDNPDELCGERFYRYVTEDGEEIWVKMTRVPYGRKTVTMITNVTDIYLQKLYLMRSDYYDSSSRLLNREAVLRRVRKFIDDGCTCGCYAVLSVNGLEKMAGDAADEAEAAIISLGDEFKRLESKHTVVGKTSHNKFLFFFAGSGFDPEERLERITEIAGKVASGVLSARITIACGGCLYPSGAETADELVSRAEFAMYQAVNTHAGRAVMFSAEEYAGKQEEYKKARAVHDVLENNSIDYYFQPIVSARNGKIFGYEALMRPVSDISLSPLDVLEIAKKDNCLVTVEKLTLWNVMKKVEENISRLDGKKVFINTIPNMLLPQSDFDALADRYGSLFEMSIMEITEESNFDDELFGEFRKRCSEMNCMLALDDFGTGYSNESNLLKFQPAFIKMDRSLITNIDSDEQKRTLVEGIVNFAKRHNIKTIAEGVETRKELEYAIFADLDYVQGFYTARPQPVIMDKISDEVADIIVSCNLKRSGRNGGSVCETTSAGTVNLVELALNGYSELLIRHSPVEIIGETSKTAEVLITVQDELDADITIRDCSLYYHPYSFVCGANSKTRVTLVGNNKFFGGFGVPVGAELEVRGDGCCEMAVHTTNPVAFGSVEETGFGKILFGLTGKCRIAMVGDLVVGFGGQYSSVHSEVTLENADVEFELKARRAVAVGAVSGSSMIGVKNSKLRIIIDGDSVLGIGNISGTLDAELSGSDIFVSLTGDSVTAFGMLTAGNGSVNVTDGCKLSISEKAKSLVGVGTRDGDFEVYCYDSIIDIFAEGNEAVGIGDIEGETSVYIKSGSVIASRISSISPKTISTDRGQIFIDSGNIISDTPVENARNSRGEELCFYKLKTDKDILFESYDNGDSGCYSAPVYKRMPEYVGVYVPKGFLPDGVEKL